MEGIQDCVTDELGHFVGRGEASDEDRYRLLLKILGDGILLSNPSNPMEAGNIAPLPHGTDRFGEYFKMQKVCFCDIPEEDLQLHTEKYSRFGLAFSRDFLITQGANPVFYIPSSAKASP